MKCWELAQHKPYRLYYLVLYGLQQELCQRLEDSEAECVVCVMTSYYLSWSEKKKPSDVDPFILLF